MSKKHDHHRKETHHAPKAAWHKDWRTWTVVALMLAAMAVYVFSVDESVGPAATPDQTEEAAAP
jgi:hypothetical protein